MLRRPSGTRVSPWTWFALSGIFLGLTVWGLGLARHQDAAKTTLWWFTLGTSALAMGQRFLPRSTGRVWLVLCLIFGLDAAIQGVVRGFFGALPQPNVIAEALANTTAAESWGFVLEQRWPIAKSTLYALLWVTIGLTGQNAWQNIAPSVHSRRYTVALVFLLSLTGLLHANPSMLRHEPFLRWGVLYARHQQASQEMANILSDRQRLWEQRANWQAQLTETRPGTIVVFIGESGNRMNWGLYGYPRDTTAALAKAFETLGGQTLLFDHARSSQAFTLPSLREALTPATEQDPDLWRQTPDFVMLARAAGYHVRWLSNQPGQDGWLASLARGADEHLFINNGNWRDSSTEDEDLLAPLQEQLKVPAPPHELIVVHLLGQHFHYALRCGKQQGPFSNIADDAVMKSMQEQGRSAHIQRARNEYDNATWCGAHSVAQLLQSVATARSNRPVRAIYFSDHGQEVGHFRDFAGHSEQDESGYTVPLWIWSNRNASPLSDRHLNTPIQLDTLDQALQHLLGIQSRWYDPKQDFLTEQYVAPVKSSHGKER